MTKSSIFKQLGDFSLVLLLISNLTNELHLHQFLCLVLLCDQNSFGRSKMVLVRPNWFGLDHNDLVTTQMKWSWPKWIGQVQIVIFVLEIKTIAESWDIKTPSVGIILTYLAKLSLILVKFPSCCSKSKIEPYFLITAQKIHTRNISCSNLRHYTTDEIK